MLQGRGGHWHAPVWLGQARAKVPMAVPEMVQCPVFIISLEMCSVVYERCRLGVGFHIVWDFLFSLPSAVLGIDPEAGHMGGTSHNECFFYKMLTAVYWYWEVVRRSSGLWPLLLAVLLIASLVARSVTLAGLRVTWLRRRAPLGSTILTGNTVGWHPSIWLFHRCS